MSYGGFKGNFYHSVFDTNQPQQRDDFQRLLDRASISSKDPITIISIHTAACQREAPHHYITVIYKVEGVDV